MTSPEKGVLHFLFTWHAALFVALSATLAVWPVLLHGDNPFVITDSFVYLDQGERVWRFVASLVTVAEFSAQGGRGSCL